MKKVEEKLKADSTGQLTTIDGLRLAFSDGWLLIRPSGTEPKIRITAEAKSATRTKQLYNVGLKAIQEALRKQERAKA
jgi:phosphoglucosamine mutase